MIVLVILAVITVLFLRRFLNKEKRLSPLGTITMVTGAVKCGKSTTAVYLALKSYRKARLIYYIKSFIKPNAGYEKPLLYSNIPLDCDYVPLTLDIVLRKKRIAQKSVCLIDECSLLADSQLVKDQTINEQLLMFYKLYGHMSHGGTLVCDTQSMEDNHYACKRCVNSFLYVYKLDKFFPLFMRAHVLEQRYASDGSVVSMQTGDIEDNLKKMWIPKKVWKKFDTYAYSTFTDNLPCVSTTINADGNLKATYVLSLRKSFRNLRVIEECGKDLADSPMDSDGKANGKEPTNSTAQEVVNEKTND